MLFLAIMAFLALVGMVSLITLADCWVRGRYTLESLRKESALLEASFLPMARPKEQRLRQSLRFEALATPDRRDGWVPVQRLAAGRSQSSCGLKARGVA